MIIDPKSEQTAVTDARPLDVLIVEDNPGDVRLLREHLREAEGAAYEVTSYADLATACAAVRARRFDVILLDLALPDCTGTDTLVRLRGAAPSMPVIVLTGLDDLDIGDATLQRGAQDYVSKDRLTPEVLARTIRYAISRQRADDQLQRSQAQLQQAQKMETIGRLVGGIAHDYNNLLMTILLNADLIRGELPDTGEAREYVDEIRDAARRNVDLTRQLLTFSRLQEVKSQRLNINDVLGEVGRILRRLIGEDVVLHIEPDTDTWDVEGDAIQLEQVLINMAVNARDAMPGGGDLHIRTANAELDEDAAADIGELSPGAYAAITIEDSGVGIPPHLLDSIFEPFFTTKEAGKGTGLGLSTCYGIVRQSGGAIRVRSRLGEGSRFTIYLPRASDGALAPARERREEREVAGGSETVLIVEDDVSVRTVAARVLKKQGYRVIEAANGEEALSLIRHGSHAFDVLLTDVVMPQMGGSELVARLRESRPHLRVICMSGYVPDPEALRRSIGEDAVLLTKPCRPEVLLQAIRGLLDGTVEESPAGVAD